MRNCNLSKIVFMTGLCVAIGLGGGCDRDENSIVLLTANPSTMVLGEKHTATIISNRDFFSGRMKTPIKSDNGLILKQTKEKDDRHIVAEFRCDESTKTGMHTFEINIGRNTGYLDMSVVLPISGPGEISATGNEATAGAEFAILKIIGDGTHFDEFCTVEFQGADGVNVALIDVRSASEMDVIYSVDLKQEATTAEVIIKDGQYEYVVPFSIADYEESFNRLIDQVLVKGIEGKVVLDQPSVNIDYKSTIICDEESVVFGAIEQDENFNFFVPVLVPYDYEKDTLDFQVKAFENSGAFLEMLNVQTELLEPAYFVLSPAVLPLNSIGSHEIVILSEGVNWEAVEDMSIGRDDGEANDMQSVNFERISPNKARMVLEIAENTEPGASVVEIYDGKQVVNGVVAVSQYQSMKAYYLSPNVSSGSSIFMPIAVQVGDLETPMLIENEQENSVSIELIPIDRYSVVARIKTELTTSPGEKRFFIRGEKYEYMITFNVYESEISVE